ncbi:DEAD/DEAH box helicase, partial [Trichloromonas sp.]|uniref:DEAD/DEAH box helicase n=1 Tax=Trichloromonas sp. TaxID=3069249 RepID=UPI003D813116
MDTDGPRDEELEPTLDSEPAPMMEPVAELAATAAASAVTPRRYWEAQGFADAIHRDFEKDLARGDFAAMRERFYILARYYGKTLAILRHALLDRQEPLLQASLRNLVALHHPFHHMHDIAPSSVPIALTLDKRHRRRLIEDLIVEVLQESAVPLSLADLTTRVNELHLLANAGEKIIREHLENLSATGHLTGGEEGYRRSHRVYVATNLDQAGLEALLGEELYPYFEQGGFHGLAAIVDRRQTFREFLHKLSGFGAETAELFIAAARELLGPPSVAPDLVPWHHADLIGSLVPRPYQTDAFAIFRGYGYQGQVIEAPTGSGKTLIGMMCIQDWLRTLAPGQSILVLVPTVNYQQQWFGELCHKPTGLRMAPDMIFAGTQAALDAEVAATGISPAVIVMTYAALAQAGSATGKGGFDQNSIEIFLQGNAIRYVILDEVHKVVEDPRSISAEVTRLLTEWLRDGTLSGMIGFSGTAAAYRRRFASLGLQLVYTMPAADLIAYGFVAPFAELGIPFAYSDREQQVRVLLDEYKIIIHEFVELAGSDRLRGLFAAIPLDERVALGRDILRMYAGRANRERALAERFSAWESGGPLTMNELHLLILVQLARGWSDQALVTDGFAPAEREARLRQFEMLCTRLEAIREKLRGQIYLPDIVRRLEAAGFATTLDAAALHRLPAESTSLVQLAEGVRDGLATTVVGLYDSLKSFYLRAGEGRVDCIKAIVQAERSIRPVSGIIVFDTGKRIPWERGVATPGYSGVAGLFAEMLGDGRFTPMEVLSSEIYFPWAGQSPLPEQVAGFIRQEILLGQQGRALFGLVTQGLELAKADADLLASALASALKRYVADLGSVHAARAGEFNREVLKGFRRQIRRAGLGPTGEKLLARLDLKHQYLAKWVGTFFDYAMIATRFSEPRLAELRQVSGELQKFFVVRMADGDRKQLMYDLTSRIVDAESLPVNMVIVSPWARTGWNVIRPNLLIDATATRNVTAWQQLRGRAMRALSGWDHDCYRLVMLLLGSQAPGLDESANLPPDVVAAVEQLHG